MVPTDPVLDFRLPRFSDNGYAQWILRGGQGIYDSDAQVRVKEMSLRIYSGDERKVLEMTIDSPEATLLIKENRAVSDSPIEIIGSNFKVFGTGWTWDGTRKEIEVKSDVTVEFSQEIVGMLSGGALEQSDQNPTVEESRLTEISSERLRLNTTPEAYHFQFINSVKVTSGDTYLQSELLVAIADITEENDSEDASITDLELDSIDKIIATERVIIAQAGNVLEAEEARFSVREQSAEFNGNPVIKTSGAHLSGHSIYSEKGKLIVNSDGKDGRARMTVFQTESLGISKQVSSEQETIVLADTIKMRQLEPENQFNFEGSVEATFGLILLKADALNLYLDPNAGEAAETSETATNDSENADFRLGEVVRVVSSGSVYIRQEDQLATCDHAILYPRKEQAVLFGNPRVENEQAIITGYSMELKRGLAVVNSSEEQLAQVILPKLPDLGTKDLQLTDEAKATDLEEPVAGSTEISESETIVKAQTLLMTEESDHFLINFAESVSVEGTNLKALCNRMDVVLVKSENETDDEGQMLVKTINAYEDIVFEQTESGRTATADKAMIQPIEGKVVLEGNAVLIDTQGRVEGHRITIHKDKRRASVEGDGSDTSRARIMLPEMDLPVDDL